MSAVHDQIAQAAWGVQQPSDRELLRPHLDAFKLASGYPDIFADRTNVPATAAKVGDADAARFLWPDPPTDEWYQRVTQVTERQNHFGMPPLRWGAHMAEYYIHKSLVSLKEKDILGAAKFLAVYSHVIGDTTEPVHAVHPHVLDFVIPPSPEWMAFELHVGIEMLCAPVNIDGYVPKLLGETIEQAAMGAIAGLLRARDVGASLAVPITQALYAGQREKALALSSEAQNESARQFADFVHTVFWLFSHPRAGRNTSLNLVDYPYVAADVDMLYRYRPTRNTSLFPYTGKSHPLALPGKEAPETVSGLGTLPFLGPPYIAETKRQTSIDYFLVPGAYQFFEARVGVNPHFPDSAAGVVFRVLLDGEEAYRSDSLTITSKPLAVKVPLKRARWLTLATHYAPNATREQMAQAKDHLGWASHSVWAEPRLVAGS